ncbi:MAG: hypothetical protein KAY32_12720 [Candidatus Eisenbacteria sp.]|nr:hypothetical protein [Candidatus Eisenbacteria bacterium]
MFCKRLKPVLPRILIIVIAVAIALAAQLCLVRSSSPDKWLKFIALIFAAHAFLQLILRYWLLPRPTVRIVDADSKPLGSPEPIGEQGLVGHELLWARHQNHLRQFLVLRAHLEHRDAPWLPRALGPRLPVEGAVARFRYRLEGKGGTWTPWRAGRWDDVLEPLTLAGQVDRSLVQTNQRLPKLYPSDLQNPDRLWPVAFAMRKIGEDGFFHFNDESYNHQPDWRNPSWVLPSGTYEVQAELAGYGLAEKVRFRFRLICSPSEFRIEDV